MHVAHAIIDGVIDIPRMKDYLKDIPDGKISADAVSLDFLERKGEALTYGRIDCGCVLVFAYAAEDGVYVGD